MKSQLLLFFTSLILLLNLATAQKPMNVVFVLSDNQSYYEMSCHGHQDLKTPHLDRLAKQSVEFSHFYAPPYCSPSRSVIMSGRYAMRSGVFTTIAGRSIMHRQETTLAQILKQQNYRTAIFGKWHLGYSYPYRAQDRGFEEVFVHGGGGVGQMEDYYGNTLFDTTFLHNDQVVKSKGYCTDTLFDKAIDFVSQHKEETFFCFVSTPVTHSPHFGPKELVEELKQKGFEKNAELYGQIINLDENIGRLMTHIDELDLSENTIFIFASDQGMSDRGAPHGEQKLGLGFDPAHHVPFMIRMPGLEPRVTSRLAGMIDFFPTILDLCNIEVPEYVDGMSLKPLLHQNGWPDDRTLIIQCPRSRVATKWKNSSVKTERWRLVDGEKLYNIKQDPRQSNNIADQFPEVVKKLRAAYEDYWADLPEQETTLSRMVLGAIGGERISLSAMEWYKGDSPWNHKHFQSNANGAWAIEVAKECKYQFKCYIYPKEADKPMGITKAKIKVGTQSLETDVDPNSRFVSFELHLKKGQYDLETLLVDVQNKTRGALFIHIEEKS